MEILGYTLIALIAGLAGWLIKSEYLHNKRLRQHRFEQSVRDVILNLKLHRGDGPAISLTEMATELSDIWDYVTEIVIKQNNKKRN